MKKLRSRQRVMIVLLAGAMLLVLAGLVLLGAYVFLSRETTAQVSWVNPVDAVVATAIAPDLAVLTLAGEPEERIAQASLDARELETAYATLAYGVLLSDAQRSGLWLLLAGQYQAREPARAAIAYQAAMDQAALAPTLGDLARADIALQVARGYSTLDRAWTSELALAEAENIARFSVTLLPAQRRSLLLRTSEAYDRLEAVQAARTIREKLDVYSAGPGISVEPAQPLIPTLRGSVVLPADVAAALATRQQAAASMAARWLSSGTNARGTLAQALGQALQAEDEVRAGFYATAETLELPDRLAMLHDQIAWLTIKYRAARGAYGASLVPDWEGRVGEIATALTDAYTALINGYGQQLDTLDAVEGLRARVELLRQGVLWTRLGLFSEGAESILGQQLTEASQQLWTRQGGAGLTIVAQDAQGMRFYLLAGSDSGQAAPTARN